MDTSTVEQILASAELCLEAIKTLQEVVSVKLDNIKASIDQYILKELQSSYDALRHALITDNQETKIVRLRFAEDNLLKNRINPSLKTGKLDNSYIIALADYGLALICDLRDDKTIAAEHILKAFESDTRVLRTELAPKVYEDVFKPKCGIIFEWYTKQKEEIRQKSFVFGQTWQRGIAVLGEIYGTVNMMKPGNASLIRNSI